MPKKTYRLKKNISFHLALYQNNYQSYITIMKNKNFLPVHKQYIVTHKNITEFLNTRSGNVFADAKIMKYKENNINILFSKIFQFTSNKFNYSLDYNYFIPFVDRKIPRTRVWNKNFIFSFEGENFMHNNNINRRKWYVLNQNVYFRNEGVSIEYLNALGLFHKYV